jgi:hypothetical protein
MKKYIPIIFILQSCIMSYNNRRHHQDAFSRNLDNLFGVSGAQSYSQGSGGSGNKVGSSPPFTVSQPRWGNSSSQFSDNTPKSGISSSGSWNHGKFSN